MSGCGHPCPTTAFSLSFSWVEGAARAQGVCSSMDLIPEQRGMLGEAKYLRWCSHNSHQFSWKREKMALVCAEALKQI